MNRAGILKLDLHRVEGFVFFAAMLLAIVVEGACVYWLGVPAALRAGEPPTIVVQWTASTLPQYWLLGALTVMLYRIAVMAVPPKRWGGVESQQNRSAFFRLWGWAIAVGAVQMAALYLDRLSWGGR
jgi:hypothetical protein